MLSHTNRASEDRSRREVLKYRDTSIKKDNRKLQVTNFKPALRYAWSNARQVADKTSLHGIQSISSKEIFWLIKIVWIACLAVSWAFFIFVAYNTIVLYKSYPKVTQITKAFEAIPDFPAVDFCSLNAYDGFVSLPTIKELIKNKSISINSSNSLREFIDNTSNQLKSYFDYKWIEGNFDTYYAGFYLTQILLNCEFGGKKCNYEDFYYYHDYSYGSCFRFNGGADLPQEILTDYDFTPYPIKKSFKPGLEKGLRLQLYTGTQDQIQYAFKSGFRIIVHNQSIIPFPDQDGIDVPVGTNMNIGLKRGFLYRLPSPYSNCIDQLTEDVAKQNDILAIMYEKKQSNEIKEYQANYCMAICYQKFIVKTCSCISLSLSLLNSTFYNSSGNKIEGCYQTKDVNCMIAGEIEFYNSDAVNQCYSLCPNECNVISYDFKVNQAPFTRWFAYMNQKEETDMFDLINYGEDIYDVIMKSVTGVNVYYESKYYTVIQEFPQLTLDYLVGNLGGNLSLFSGMSFLSFVEFIELILTFGVIFVCYYFLYKPK